MEEDRAHQVVDVIVRRAMLAQGRTPSILRYGRGYPTATPRSVLFDQLNYQKVPLKIRLLQYNTCKRTGDVATGIIHTVTKTYLVFTQTQFSNM